MNLLRRLSSATLAVGLFALGASGCAGRFIPNTDVEDNDHNRRVILFCEKYRRAVEDRDVPLLLSLASPSYFEDGANADASDDIDYDGLRDYLEGRFKDTSAIRYEIRYRRVEAPRGGHVFVEYTYSASYKVPPLERPKGAEGAEASRVPRGPQGDGWHRTVSDNRLELVDDGKELKFVAGM